MEKSMSRPIGVPADPNNVQSLKEMTADVPVVTEKKPVKQKKSPKTKGRKGRPLPRRGSSLSASGLRMMQSSPLCSDKGGSFSDDEESDQSVSSEGEVQRMVEADLERNRGVDAVPPVVTGQSRLGQSSDTLGDSGVSQEEERDSLAMLRRIVAVDAETMGHEEDVDVEADTVQGGEVIVAEMPQDLLDTLTMAGEGESLDIRDSVDSDRIGDMTPGPFRDPSLPMGGEYAEAADVASVLLGATRHPLDEAAFASDKVTLLSTPPSLAPSTAPVPSVLHKGDRRWKKQDAKADKRRRAGTGAGASRMIENCRHNQQVREGRESVNTPSPVRRSRRSVDRPERETVTSAEMGEEGLPCGSGPVATKQHARLRAVQMLVSTMQAKTVPGARTMKGRPVFQSERPNVVLSGVPRFSAEELLGEDRASASPARALVRGSAKWERSQSLRSTSRSTHGSLAKTQGGSASPTPADTDAVTDTILRYAQTPEVQAQVQHRQRLNQKKGRKAPVERPTLTQRALRHLQEQTEVAERVQHDLGHTYSPGVVADMTFQSDPLLPSALDAPLPVYGEAPTQEEASAAIQRIKMLKKMLEGQGE
ncbi:hypothetical protein KIPB_010057 [Kipferlia bialata]|uniref:Uncharacterized protein n=1 Tax=Kipferlia bialata TaxID=797122 RepID=A0A9K3GMQ6_9EUKA|nr:hypothetical protein KIPB_010057 [Kipferlia bialata]|eukprot:g10057.t1